MTAMLANIRPALLIILIGIGLVFAIQNVADVEVQFLFWSIALPRAILILAVLALGILIGWILHSLHVRRKRQPPSVPTRHDFER
jgi:uncharacterized integral membrane protein